MPLWATPRRATAHTDTETYGSVHLPPPPPPSRGCPLGEFVAAPFRVESRHSRPNLRIGDGAKGASVRASRVPGVKHPLFRTYNPHVQSARTKYRSAGGLREISLRSIRRRADTAAPRSATTTTLRGVVWCGVRSNRLRVHEDIVRPHAQPDDMRIALVRRASIREERTTVIRPGHFICAWKALKPLHMKARTKWSFRP